MRFSHHAVERMESRGVIESEILHVISSGRIEPKKDDYRDGTWRYAFLGSNPDGDRILRAIVGIDDDLAIVVTVIALNEGD